MSFTSLGTRTTGANNHRAILTDDIVVEMRLCHEAGWGNRELMQRFGLKESAVSCVIRRINWTHVRLADRYTPEQLDVEVAKRRVARERWIWGECT